MYHVVNSEEIVRISMNYGTRFLLAILIFIIGKWFASFLCNIFQKALTRSKLDKTITSFLSSCLYSLIMTLVLIATLGQVGIQTTSLAAVLGATSLAIGLSLKDSMANLAEGVMLITFKHFKVGDFIEVSGNSGTVLDIKLFYTKLKTGDNKLIIIPNSKVTSGNIINYSAHPTRRVDLLFGISYEDDIVKAKMLLNELLEENPRVLAEPAPKVAVKELADSSVNLVVRPWVKREDYWDVYFELTEQVKLRFDQAGISIPYPQRQLHYTNLPAAG